MTTNFDKALVSNVIETVEVSKVIDGQAILQNINFAVKDGSVHGLVGSNGAGKTTLLRLINGVYEASSGEIRVFGKTIIRDVANIRQRVHLVSADGAFYPGFRVQDLLHYASLLYDKWDETRAKDLIKVLELPLHQPIRKLSLGMKMQLRLAVALASRPDVLLLDEPTNGLDPVVRRQFLGLIVQEVAGTGLSVVFATHRLEELEAVADDISVLYRGRMVLSGSLEGFKSHYHEIVAVANTTIADHVWEHPSVLAVSSHGKIQSCIVNGDTSVLRQRLVKAGAVHVDEQPIKFEDLFRALMEKEGYTRDAILLS
ncbi:ABC transporter ATP-binding protein [Alicyclobacillus fastidiosus]|uniref:ABC transporter ATP-binding protein n=1 Tax=Alicyclobacillus fastidiosus TaxID=392011 RepID=A0ABV5AJB5_9BACL|nr:ABC transporter ATP-binding protein [Alicyclobacillus fastidiosus]WEH08383.1 ABC transporter ATP-binding protein [Alicyclobacillus fastidiosus]